MEIFYKIVANDSIIDEIMIDSSGNLVHKSEIYINNDITEANVGKVKSKFHIKRKTCLDGYCCSAFVYLLQWSQVYKYYVRNYLINKFSIPDNTNGYILIKIESINPKKEIIDYKWNYRIIHLCKERYELENAMSWLSTLGGGYSCLGDYIERYAIIAGKISAQQFKIALKLGDSQTVSRCRLYYSISLMQQGYLREARAIIQNEYNKITAGLIKDDRLKRMCHGIWAKLKFEWALKYKSRNMCNVHNSVI